jgi:hypothetical protein
VLTRVTCLEHDAAKSVETASAAAVKMLLNFIDMLLLNYDS